MTVDIAKPNITVVDGRDLRRAGIVGLLKTWAEHQELEIVSAAPAQVLDEFSVEPDCRMLILSVGSEPIASRQTTQWLKALHALAPDASLVIVSDCDQPEEVLAALDAGAHGFIPTDLDPELALQALSFVLMGGSYFPPSAIQRLSRHAVAWSGGSGSGQETANGSIDTKPPESHDGDVTGDWPRTRSFILTAREHEVLELLRLGKANKLIARQLGMTEATVKVHVRHIMRKVGATNRTQAALSANSNLPHGERAHVILEAPVIMEAPVAHQ